MTVLYENTRRAKKARLGIIGAIVWSIGWFYWAYVMSSGESGRLGVLALVIGILPLTVLYFYSRTYVVRIERDGDFVIISTLSVFSNRQLRIPVSAITGVTAYISETKSRTPGNSPGLAVQVRGRRIPFIVDLQGDQMDVDAIVALGGPRSENAS